ATSATRFEPALKQRITALLDAAANAPLDEIGQVDVALAQAFARAANELLHGTGIDPGAVAAIGSHGQTLRHRPDLPLPFTWQIGDPSTLAELTGITVVGDFRRRDIAAGGQGAPLLPVFHDQVFRDANEDRGIVNIGGIANLTVLTHAAAVTGFDTGPGNRLLDAWVLGQRGVEYDENGAWAGSGRCDASLLQTLLDEPYLQQRPPKSTGRELFNLTWLEAQLGRTERRPEDVQATLLEFTARSIASAVRTYAPGATLYVCGGGAHNRALLEALGRLLSPAPVRSTAALGLDPDFVEAVAFAWFAERTLCGLTSSAATVTGARGARILGGVYRNA
ncbi:MAG: anhydro-N-acetylmuramic acid kinase, partial [Pseudomonadota bacterium]|nr:anhydro-N-acetylmuramic acid kinase [Pseudomonadota bacterium]